MAQTLTLQGIVRITQQGDYNLVLPSNGVPTQIGLPLQNDEIFIVIENIVTPEFVVNLFLPKISDFNGGWNTKIYILNKNDTFMEFTGSVFLNSYASETYTDYLINQSESAKLSYNTLVHIFDTNVWGVLGLSPFGG